MVFFLNWWISDIRKAHTHNCKRHMPMSIHDRLPVQSSNIQDAHSSNTLTSTMETTEQKCCYCKKEKPGEMIG